MSSLILALKRTVIIWARREGGRGTMELPHLSWLCEREKIKLYPVNGRGERIRKEEIWLVVEVLV